MNLAIALLFLAGAIAEFVTADPVVTCVRTYKKVGCIKTSANSMPELLVTDRDVNSDKYQGILLNWMKFGESIHSLACRCAAIAAVGGYTMFTIRYFAECYGTKAAIDLASASVSNDCIGPSYRQCIHSDNEECVGKDFSEYVYQTVAEIPTTQPSVNGGYADWTDWGSCTAVCGEKGEQSRERLCTRPPPSGPLGKDCSGIGPSTELRPCNRFACFSCPDMLGDYKGAAISASDGILQGKWRSDKRPDFNGVFTADCKGEMTFPDDRKYTFEFEKKKCRIVWDNDKNHIWQLKYCITGDTCPEMLGDYTHALLNMADGYPIGAWKDGLRPEFNGVFTDRCQGEMTFPDDRKYTFSYDANWCRIYWDGDKNHIWQKASCERVFISRNYPLYNIGVSNNDAYIMNGVCQSFDMISPGLNGRPGSISFRSKTLPTHFLRHQDWLLKLHPYENAQLYKDDATFFIRMDKFFPRFAAFESSNYPGHFLRHQNYRMMISAYEDTDLYRNDASYKISGDLCDNPALTKKLISYNYPDHGVGVGDADLTYILRNVFQDFRVVSPGLNERRGSVSIMSASRPQFYLRHQGFLLKLHPFAFDQLYRDDATYFIRYDKFFPGFVSFESSNYPNHFLRHQNGQMKLAPYEDSDLYRMDASFKMA